MSLRCRLAILLTGICLVASPAGPTQIRHSSHGEPQEPWSGSQAYLSVDGSTSAHPLQLAIACHLLGAGCSWQDGGPFTSTRAILPDPEGKTAPETLEFLYSIWHSGTHQAYLNLISREADIILVAREPSSTELESAARAGVELEQHPVARDAFVFLNHRDNPVDSLSVEQVREIYTGAMGNWAAVGGPDLPLNAYQRNPDSGSQELMQALVMRGTPMMESPNMILMSMMGPINAIANDPAGLGYSVYFYAEHIFPEETVRIMAVDGVRPNTTTISTGSYSLSTQVFAALRSGQPDGAAREWLRWVLSPDGQRVVAESGYVPLH